ncbi:MAG: hypothetical protein ACRYGF_09775 [Janthinobacterium lividum]
MKKAGAKPHSSRLVAGLALIVVSTGAQTTPPPVVPDWALPGSATHRQVPPPADFHRPTRTELTPIGIFSGQSEIGGPLITGSSSFDSATGRYTVRSAGYNIWYNRDEFRFLWKKMSGDVSLAADVAFPEAGPPSDRKVVLVIRQSLDDDAKEAMVAEHGTGMVHLAQRQAANTNMTDMEFSFGGSLRQVMAQRIGIEKRGNNLTLYASLTGEPMHPMGPPIQLGFDGPFYVGIGFCPHLAATLDTGAFSNVVLRNSAGAIK